MKRTQAQWIAVQAYIVADATEALVNAAQIGDMSAVRKYAGQVERARRLAWLAGMTHRRWPNYGIGHVGDWQYTAGERFGRGRLPA